MQKSRLVGFLARMKLRDGKGEYRKINLQIYYTCQFNPCRCLRRMHGALFWKFFLVRLILEEYWKTQCTHLLVR